MKNAVVSICSFETSTKAFNIIADAVRLKGTVRTMDEDVTDLIETRFREIVSRTAEAYGAIAEIDFQRNYPVLVNSEAETEFAANAAKRVAGECDTAAAYMWGEDFAFFLQKRPGAYIHLGVGDTADLHQPDYNFNDAAIPAGCSWYVEMAESRLPLA